MYNKWWGTFDSSLRKVTKQRQWSMTDHQLSLKNVSSLFIIWLINVDWGAHVTNCTYLVDQCGLRCTWHQLCILGWPMWIEVSPTVHIWLTNVDWGAHVTNCTYLVDLMWIEVSPTVHIWLTNVDWGVINCVYLVDQCGLRCHQLCMLGWPMWIEVSSTVHTWLTNVDWGAHVTNSTYLVLWWPHTWIYMIIISMWKFN